MQKLLVTCMVFSLTTVKAEAIPFAIVGGGNSQGYGYAGILGPQSTTTPQTILLPPETPSIRTVAINNAGTSLIGCGNATGNSYIARISPDSLIPQPLNFPTNPVRGVAINDSGIGFAGCGESHDGYAARIPRNSTSPQQIMLPAGTNGIRRVAINNTGSAIIGGCNQFASNSGYAAYIPPDSTNPEQIGGNTNINYVAINDAGAGLIGGGDSSGYAAFVISNSTALQAITIPANTPPIYGVDLNNAGIGLIGASGGGIGYAALVRYNNPVPQPLSIPANTPIFGVAINNAGVGLIGGGTTTGYAALVAPDGKITPLALPAIQSPILDVAISDQGVGIIGGEDLTGQNTYAALVAPNGALTPIDIPAGNGVNFVAINNAFVASVGPYSSAFNTQLAAMQALDTRFRKFEISSDFCSEKETEYSLWATGLGTYVHSRAHGKIPCFTNKIGGVLAGVDCQTSNLLLGGGIGYLSNTIKHSHLHEGIVCIYGASQQQDLLIQAVLWGGGYRVNHDRHMLSTLSAKACFSGWIFAPQVEIAIPVALNDNHNNWIEPFGMLDWVNNWQGCFRETGASGFNLVMNDQHTSLLYSEAGIRAYQGFECRCGRCSLEEKLSYINQKPFHIQKQTTYFMVPTSQFLITTNSSRTENLCGVQLSGFFSPNNPSRPYIHLSFQGMFGSCYRSYFVSLTIGKDF